MTLTHILVFAGVGLLAALILKDRGRGWLLLVVSVLAVYWLQPPTPIRNFDFWLPTATIALSVLVWALTRPDPADFSQQDRIASMVIVGTILAISLTRYTTPACCLTPTRPPAIAAVLIGLVGISLIAFLLGHCLAGRTFALNVAVWGILLTFVILKTESLALASGASLRSLTGQNPDLATPFDIRWLGFSYIAFRLLHVLRDRIAGRLDSVPLRDFLTFVIFFPALTAGPIDKLQRFIKDLEAQFNLDANRLLAAGRRIILGIFMKFALGDALALFALNPANSIQTQSAGWMWVLTYAYAFRIYFDFAGYTQIAIGIGMLFGVQLPENFNRPYLKPNLTQFWNSWHMTLAQWFRGYFFNPLTRSLRAKKVSVPVIILVGQAGTMLLLGLWHGITWNYVIWGLWHGLGLFVHNRWAEFSKTRPAIKNPRWADLTGALLNFHFVTLGWVWFALPNPQDALHTFSILFGGSA